MAYNIDLDRTTFQKNYWNPVLIGHFWERKRARFLRIFLILHFSRNILCDLYFGDFNHYEVSRHRYSCHRSSAQRSTTPTLQRPRSEIMLEQPSTGYFLAKSAAWISHHKILHDVFPIDPFDSVTVSEGTRDNHIYVVFLNSSFWPFPVFPLLSNFVGFPTGQIKQNGPKRTHVPGNTNNYSKMQFQFHVIRILAYVINKFMQENSSSRDIIKRVAQRWQGENDSFSSGLILIIREMEVEKRDMMRFDEILFRSAFQKRENSNLPVRRSNMWLPIQ